jgi:hypothetical protein
MRWSQAGYALAAMLLVAAPSAVAQGNPMDSPQLRQMIQKFWNPVMGSGEVYRSEDKSGPGNTMQLVVVGKEMVDGKQAYWLELAMNIPEMGGMAYAKDLIVPGEETPRRVIMQIPGEAAMELPVNGHPKPLNVENTHLHRVGTETITVPAGTFECEHWKDDGGDYWMSSKASPVKLVKETGKNGNDVLVKVIAGAKSQITGPVKPFDPSVFMRHMKGPGNDR